MVYESIRELLFRMKPEVAHERTLRLLSATAATAAGRLGMEAVFRRNYPELRMSIAGMHFPNPIGLAAGYDKNAVTVPGLFSLGFGFVEVGTVTPRPQPGNPRPRLFRYPADEAVINRMGFNNEGAVAMAARLAEVPKQPGPLGINLGKNKTTPNELAYRDYVAGLKELFPFGDYFVVNVSSPNTPELRELQTRRYLEALLGQVQEANKKLAHDLGTSPKPLFVKVAPDLGPSDADDIVHAALGAELAGLIATNTTIERTGLTTYTEPQEGGLSGAPLTDRARQVIAAFYRRVGERLPIIGVGGIMTPRDAYLHLRAGATAVQVYTGLIYRGPGLAKQICDELAGIARSLGAGGLGAITGEDVRRYPEL